MDVMRDLLAELGLSGHAVFAAPVLFGAGVCWGLIQMLKAWRAAHGALPLNAFSLRVLAFAVAAVGTWCAGVAVEARPWRLLAVYAVVSGIVAPSVVRAVKILWRRRFPKQAGEDPDDGEETTLFSWLNSGDGHDR